MAYTAIFPNETSIFIVPAGTNGASLATSDKIVGEISTWKSSGLERQKDLINVFGGQVDKRAPITLGEISFDVIISNTASSTLDRWDKLKFSGGTSADAPVQYAVFLSSLSGGNWKTLAANNADVTVVDTNFDADDLMKKSVTLKFAGLTSLGVANLRTSALAYSTAFFAWA